MSIPELNKKYTYADYLTWPEEERWEIIDGVPYMKAAPSPVHQEILMELSRQIANYLKEKSCKVYPAPFCVRLMQGNEHSPVKRGESIVQCFGYRRSGVHRQPYG